MSDNNFEQKPDFALDKKKTYPSFSSAALFMLLFTLWYFAVSIAVSSFITMNENIALEYDNNAVVYYGMTIVFQILYLGLPILLMLKIYNGNKSELLRLNPLSGKEIGLTVVIGFLMLVGNTALTSVNYYVSSLFTNIELPQVPPAYTTSAILLMIVSGVLIAPVLEEISMRGVMMRGLEGKSKWFAIIITGAYFGMVHLSHYTIVPKVLGGILLCYVVYATNSIYSGMIIHLINNGISCIITIISDNMSALEGTNEVIEETTSDMIVSMIMNIAVAVAVVIAIVSLLYVMRSFTKTPDGEGGYIQKGKVREKLESEKRIRFYHYIPIVLSFAVIIAYMAMDVILSLK